MREKKRRGRLDLFSIWLENHGMRSQSDEKQTMPDAPVARKINVHSYPWKLTPEEILNEVGRIYAYGLLRLHSGKIPDVKVSSSQDSE